MRDLRARQNRSCRTSKAIQAGPPLWKWHTKSAIIRIPISACFPMSPAREVELKLEVPADSFNRLARSSLLQAARKNPSKPATLVSIYFDTDELKLRNKSLSLQ